MSVDDTITQRETTHGSFVAHAELCQAFKALVRNSSGWDKMASRQQEAVDMILNKISRVCVGDPDFVDHWHDMSGYARLVEKALKPHD